ncbi:Vacuolar protein sorting-associated protein 45 [Intoshia linei]|uniref:Vacuolar protein sorting-associated protein 45 n=1 Tax=Intoshia linei TaxID=1819745 RepID=A0A177B9W5_9BILA|nr:Vacuolar protein sorting-associated protein 45 [Intoshia linei]
MNARMIIKGYIDQMSLAYKGIKVLLMDSFTISVTSVVLPHSELISRSFYLFENIKNINVGSQKTTMEGIACVCFLRPTLDNIDLLCTELKKPTYGSYYLYFVNKVKPHFLRTLANADRYELVKKISTVFADFVPLEPHLFTLNMNNIYKQGHWDPDSLSHCKNALLSCSCALKLNPLVRYQFNSQMSLQLASELQIAILHSEEINTTETYHHNATIIILDRNIDLISPILTQWTYQAVIHEIFGIDNNKISSKNVAQGYTSNAKESFEFIVNHDVDEFYMMNRYKNIGDVSIIITKSIQSLKNKEPEIVKDASINDMKNHIKRHQIFQNNINICTNHMKLINEVTNITKYLVDIAKIEQSIIFKLESQDKNYQNVISVIKNKKISNLNALRLCLIYLISDLSKTKELAKQFLTRNQTSYQYKLFISKVLNTSKNSIFKNRYFKDKTIKTEENPVNIFDRKQSVLVNIVKKLHYNSLDIEKYPFTTCIHESNTESISNIIVFIVGGATYAESLEIHNLNLENKKFTTLLGSTNIHNFNNLINEMNN